MAAPNQYKSSAGGAWANIPAEALTGTAQGGPFVLWPQPTGLTPTGEPCAAVGRPSIRIKSTWMNGAGVKWWFDRVGDALAVDFWLSAFDPRANAWTQWKGRLARPVVNPDAVIMAAAGTYYQDVSITLGEIEAA